VKNRGSQKGIRVKRSFLKTPAKKRKKEEPSVPEYLCLLTPPAHKYQLPSMVPTPYNNI